MVALQRDFILYTIVTEWVQVNSLKEVFRAMGEVCLDGSEGDLTWIHPLMPHNGVRIYFMPRNGKLKLNL